MVALKDIILESDIFAHSTLQRYRNNQSYRTLTGGIVSIVMVTLFVGIFYNLILDTFSYSIISSQLAIIYDDDPTFKQVNIAPANKFMFAVGLSGVDLGASQRYFDIYFNQRSTALTPTGTTKVKSSIALVPCTEQHWKGVTDSITKSYTTINFKQWLCPPIGYNLQLQGKYTSQIFKFAQIKVNKCTANNSLFPGSTCYNSTDLTSYLNSYGQFTFNFYYINPVINAGERQFISYYLEDRNYFSFDTYTGVSANLFFNEYSITTDETIMTWSDNSEINGVKTSDRAIGQDYKMLPGQEYFKFYLRKGSTKDQHTRSFQKLDQTLSYIGGLFGTLIILMTIINLYSKYCYELDMGDRIFKQNNGGSFGSENFNFIVFLGYLIFVCFEKFGIILNWKNMKKYHQCRSECEKQLDIDLLFKKIAHFQEISKIVLEDHQQKVLLMVPKPTIYEARLNRKRFLVKSILYNRLEKKSREIYVGPEQFQKKLDGYLNQQSNSSGNESEDEKKIDKTLKVIQQDLSKGYRKAQVQSNPLTQRIMNRLSVQQVAGKLLSFILQGQQNKEEEDRKQRVNRHQSIISQEEEHQNSAQSFFRSNKVYNIDAQQPEFIFGSLINNLKKKSKKQY